MLGMEIKSGPDTFWLEVIEPCQWKQDDAFNRIK